MINIELYSLEAEENIISEILSQKVELLEDIKLDYFCNNTNKAIVKAMMDLHAKGQIISIVSLEAQLKNNKAGVSKECITRILVGAISTNIQSDLHILKDFYKRRTAINILKESVIDLRNIDNDIDTINMTVANKFDQLTFDDSFADDSPQSLLKRLEIDLNSAYNPSEQRYKYGIVELDKLTWGLHKEELTTVGAKSGVGKTALAVQIAKNLIKNGLKVLFISREMSAEQMAKRFIISETGIEGNKFRSRSFTIGEREQIRKAQKILKNLYVNTEASTVTAIKKRIRKIKPEVVIIDYLQLLTPEKSENSREREVATISREIKSMTQDFKIPIIQLSQLNDENGDKRPRGERHIRESKAIYQNSNNVIYIHKPNKDELKEYINNGDLSLDQLEEIKKENNDVVEIILDKQRDGMTGLFLKQYIKNRLTFGSIEEKDFYEITEKNPDRQQLKLI